MYFIITSLYFWNLSFLWYSHVWKVRKEISNFKFMSTMWNSLYFKHYPFGKHLNKLYKCVQILCNFRRICTCSKNWQIFTYSIVINNSNLYNTWSFWSRLCRSSSCPPRLPSPQTHSDYLWSVCRAVEGLLVRSSYSQTYTKTTTKLTVKSSVKTLNFTSNWLKYMELQKTK